MNVRAVCFILCGSVLGCAIAAEGPLAPVSTHESMNRAQVDTEKSRAQTPARESGEGISDAKTASKWSSILLAYELLRDQTEPNSSAATATATERLARSSELIIYRMPGFTSSSVKMSVEIDGRRVGVVSTTGRYIVVPVPAGAQKLSIHGELDIPVKFDSGGKVYVKVDIGMFREVMAQVDPSEGERDVRRLTRE